MKNTLITRLTNFLSRKNLAHVASYALSGYLLTKGIDVDPDTIQTGYEAVAENGLKGLVLVAQLWLTKNYISSQGKIDELAKKNELMGD